LGRDAAADQHAGPASASQPVPPSRGAKWPANIVLMRFLQRVRTMDTGKLRRKLHREGKAINEKTVAKYMREMGIMAIYPGPNVSKGAHQAGIYLYLLRNITAEAPNHIWGIGITYLRLRAGWMYLVAILDWYARSLVSWELDQSLQLDFVLQAGQQAFQSAIPRIFNSDQGSHFTSKNYIDLLKQHDVRINMDGRGRALDNIFDLSVVENDQTRGGLY
jgi:putative transposase